MEWEVLAGVPEADVRELVAIARRRRFDRHEIVFHEGDPSDSLHLIAKGRFGARLRTPLGDDVVLDILGPGDAFGELALVGEDPVPRAATVYALEPAETHCVYRLDFERLRARHASIDRALVVMLARQLRRVDQRLVDAHFVDVDRRVARRLIELDRRYEQSVIPLTQEEIAGLAGATRPSVNKALRDLQARGAIELHRGRLTIVDRELLAARAR